MANPNPRTGYENLKPLNTRTKDVQRAIQSKGGKARAKKIQQTKELVKISLYLHKFIDSQTEEIRVSLKNIVKIGGQPLLALIKEAREATEGNKNILMNPDGTALKSEGITVNFISANSKKQINDEHKLTK